MGISTPIPSELAVRLADEGVPLRAIARATQTPSAAVRDTLHQAQNDGRLLNLPREDWPPGFPRDQRALQLSRMVTDNKKDLTLAVQQMFGLTSTQVELLLLLLQGSSLDKDRSDFAAQTIEVHIHFIRRRLAPYQIDIQTLWGHGYQLSLDNRRRMQDLILERVQA